MYTAQEALDRLMQGNKEYLEATRPTGDISPFIRLQTAKDGQHPYAVIITCSDSRVIPESIFSAGIGDLFVIRTAGNYIDNNILGCIEYAVYHLKTKLVVVMGHTQCGAIQAAVGEGAGGTYTLGLCLKLRHNFMRENNPVIACTKNIRCGVERIREVLTKDEDGETVETDVQVMGALYHTDTGVVEF